MSILDLLRKGASHARAKRAPLLSDNVSRHDATDRHMLADVKRDSPMWAEHFDQPLTIPDGIDYDGAPDLYDDLWMSLHHIGEAGVKDVDEIKPSRQMGRAALERIQRTDDFHSVKAVSSGNATMSSIAFGAMAGKLRETFSDPSLTEHAERAQEMAEQERRQEQAQNEIDRLREEGKAQADAGGKLDDAGARDMRMAIKEREAAREALEQLVAEQAQAQGAMSAAVADAADEAAKAGEQAAKTWGQIAGMDPAHLKHARPDEAIALMEAFTQVPNFREFLDLIGRSTRLWRALDARKVRPGTDEIVGIDQGNDLPLVLPTELMQLGHPILRRKFFRQYVDEELLQFDPVGIDKSADGPGVMLLDMSGSTRTNSRFLKELAMTIGFCKLMHAKRRDVIVFPFNGSVKAPTTFRAGRALDMDAIIKLACLRPTGGTDIHAAVVAAERAIERLPEFGKADIVVITDGQYDFNAARDVPLKERLAEKAIRTHGVAIDHEPLAGGYLMQFCDDVVRADDLTTAAGHLVNAVA